MYGSNKDEKGEVIKSGNDVKGIVTGRAVPGHKVLSLDFAIDSTTNEPITTRAEIKFEQPNGQVFSHSFFASDEDWSIAATNREMLHICSKAISEKDYYAVVEGSANFQDFITRIKEKIVPVLQKNTYTLKLVYVLNKTKGQYYVKFPKFPNFIELDGTTPSTLKTTKYDIYERPEIPSVPAKVNTDSTDVF